MNTIGLAAMIETGIDEIDDQHRLILECQRNISLALERDSGVDEICVLLEDVKNASERHFDMEEALMRSVRYDDADEHIRMHHMELAFIGRMIDEVKGACMLPTQGMVAALTTWFFEHMRTMDVELAAALRRQHGNFTTSGLTAASPPPTGMVAKR